MTPPTKQQDRATEKSERHAFLMSAAQEVLQEMRDRHAKKGHDTKEIELNESKIQEIVDLYFELLDEYRGMNDYDNHGRFVGRDKLSSLTAYAIMAHLPFYSGTGRTSTLYAGMANEVFAYRICTILLHIREKEVPSMVKEMALHNFYLLYDEDGEFTNSKCCLYTWMITSMRLFALKYGKIDTRPDEQTHRVKRQKRH